MWRKATGYVDKIFSKEPDSEEFPVEQPVVFELAQNLRNGRRRSASRCSIRYSAALTR
jgi:hypothetical protein